jgi:hypothetical protein
MDKFMFLILFIGLVLKRFEVSGQVVSKTPNSTFSAWKYDVDVIHTQGIIGPVSGVSAFFPKIHKICWVALKLPNINLTYFAGFLCAKHFICLILDKNRVIPG